jgi:hypothetical protein
MTKNLEAIGYSNLDFVGALIHPNQHHDIFLRWYVELYLREMLSRL